MNTLLQAQSPNYRQEKPKIQPTSKDVVEGALRQKAESKLSNITWLLGSMSVDAGASHDVDKKSQPHNRQTLGPHYSLQPQGADRDSSCFFRAIADQKLCNLLRR
ncbi:MAG: hypothetical protein AAFP93_02400 [Bacteroidota bacterium]